MNAAELGRTIDAYMAKHYHTKDVLNVSDITRAILASLRPDDREEIDPRMLRHRIMARGCGYAGMRW